MRLQFLDIAAVEFDEAVAYYEVARVGLGEDFRGDVATGLQRIQNHPMAWRPLGPELRRYRLRRFPYGLIYHVSEDQLLIVAVAHLHRRPGYWRDRLRVKG